MKTLVTSKTFPLKSVGEWFPMSGVVSFIEKVLTVSGLSDGVDFDIIM